MRRLLTFVSAMLAVPTLAAAQPVIVAAPLPPPPPPVVIAPPPPPMYYAPPVGAVPPHVYIRERIRWHLRHLPRVYVQAGVIPPPPPVVVMPPPPPPVYMTPPPVYVTPPPMPLPPVPPPIIAPPPCCYAPAPAPEPVVEVYKPRPVVPMWTSRIGLGVRGTGQVLDNGWNNLGIGGEFLYRASPHLVTELAAEYDHSTGTALDRVDIPVTIGLRVHIGRPNWIVSPYFVFAGGVDIAQQDFKFATDQSIYLDGQLGGGLELRLGSHVAITADARLDAKKRANDVAQNIAATTSVDGKPVHPLGDEYGGQFRLGAAVYF